MTPKTHPSADRIRHTMFAILKKAAFAAILLCVAGVANTRAQSYFTGSFQAVFTQPEDGEETVVQIYTSPRRMLLTGLGDVASSRHRSMPGMDSGKILLRMDQQDMIFLSDEPTALRMQMQELNAAMNLMAGMQGREPAPPQANISVTETEETRRFDGYEAVKWVVLNQDDDSYFHIWVSEDFKVNTAMISEAWRGMTATSGLSPLADILRDGQTPLMAEAFSPDGKLVMKAELSNITAGLPDGVMDIPAGTRLVSLQDMVLEQMRQQ